MKNRMIIRYVVICSYLILNVFSTSAQTSIFLESVPQNTPMLDLLYVTYKLDDDTSKAVTRTMRKKDDHYYFLIEDEPEGMTCTLKVHRGSDASAERNAETNEPMTHQVLIQNGSIFGISVAEWLDIPINTTMNEQVLILDNDMLIPQLKKRRRVWVYLPEEYQVSGVNYPVVYMLDGQNLFDRFTSFAGEWKIDETMSSLKGCQKSIIVGIDNGGNDRLNEYTFGVNDSLHNIPQGNEILEFITKNLKSVIDYNFRTLKDRKNTSIGGSSLGANMALAAVIKYPDVFSKAMVLSPAYWADPELEKMVANSMPKVDTKIYYACGTNEGRGEVLQDMIKMNNLLVDIGYQENQLFMMDWPEGSHSEAFWAEEFPRAYRWLNDCVETEESLAKAFDVSPNPTYESTTITAPNGKLISEIKIYNNTGKLVKQELANEESVYQIFVNMLFPGTYNMEIKWHDGTIDSLPLYKL
ncbi:MAG: alpha/beta hydrolase-fold protein [Flavobacteriales bacterium]